MNDQRDLFGALVEILRFDGDTYDPHLDAHRLKGQHAKVWRVMSDGHWRTLFELAHASGCPEASVSARLRDFRKPRFGGHTVERRRRGKGGTWEYRVIPSSKPS